MEEGNEEYKIEPKIENNSIQITAIDKKNIKFIGLFSKEFLSDKADFLRYLSINAIFDFIKENINSKKYRIIPEELQINLIIEYSKEKKIELLIPKKDISHDKQLNIITELINIKQENKEIKKRLSDLEQKVDILFKEKEKNNDSKGFEKTINKNQDICKKIEQWIKDNFELVNKASYDKQSFKNLINKLENDKELIGNEKILIYDDIRRNLWHDEHIYGINYNGSHFFGGVFERQVF